MQPWLEVHRLFVSRALRTLIPLFIIQFVFDITPAIAQARPPPLLTSAVIRGSSVYEPAELFHLYREHLGKPITRASASAIVTGLGDHYQSAGYPRPRVTVDDELAALGVLRINVFESRIDEVTITGDTGPHRARLERLAAELERSDAMRQSALQETLRRMQRMPGLSVSASTRRDPQAPNLYRLDLEADYQPVSASMRLTNRGTEDVGPEIAIGQVVANGLAGGRLSAGMLFGAALDYDEFRGLGVLAIAAIGNRDSSLSFNAFRTRASPREAPEQIVDRYVRDRVALSYSRPVLGGPQTQLIAALELTDLTIEHSVILLRDERLRMARLGMSRSARRGLVEQVGSFDVIKGIDGFGSRLEGIGLEGDKRRADFLLLRVNWIRVQRFADSWSWRVDALAQHTAYTLPYTERFKIGGERLGRGFEVASVAGDRGIGAKIELRRDLGSVAPMLGGLAVYGFYDIGAAWRNDVPGRDSAATAGVGFTVGGARMSSSIELAKPLTHPDVEGQDDAKLFFEVRLRL